MKSPTRSAVIAFIAIGLAFALGWLAYGDTIVGALRMWFGS